MSTQQPPEQRPPERRPAPQRPDPKGLAEQPSDDRAEPVVEEERLLAVVLDAARKVSPGAWRVSEAQAELVRLRDELMEERLLEDRASVLEQMDRLARLVDQQARAADAPLDLGTPYFGHLRLIDDDERRRDILIGKRTWVHEGIRIVDWRNAPIARVFYQKDEGDDFDVQIAGKDLGGEVAVRRTLSIRDGRLERVGCRNTVYVRANGVWSELGSGPRLVGGLGAAARPDRMVPTLGTRGDGSGVREDKFLREIASLLDPQQFRLIARPDNELVAIQGSAGSGKTTVALHRVAWLNYQDPARFAASRTLIVVFSPALLEYIARVLPALGVEGVQVRLFEEWAGEMRGRIYPRLVGEYADDTPAVVTRFKLHSGLVHMLEEGYIENPELGPKALFDELFTNRAWIRSACERHAPGEFSEAQQDEIHRWCSDRHFVRVEGGGHHDDDLPNIDREDDAILIFLHQLVSGPIHGKRGVPIRYTQLVVDEAQDLSPIELKVLLDTVERRGAVTLAGDVAQKVMENNDFRSWKEVLSTLGYDGVQVSQLRISYRSTEPIMRLAHHVLGPLAPVEAAIAPRDGQMPELYRFRSRGEMLTFLGDALRRLERAEPLASVGILTVREWQAVEAYELLRRSELRRLRRVVNYDFAFAPGIEIADVRQAKGLEFDYVVLIDVDADSYPESDASRHLLHVALTRAAHQVWLTSVGTPTGLLPDWLPVTAL